MRPTVHGTGFSVVSPQTEKAHLVDIVIIHGLQGHPLKTWLYTTPSGSGTKSSDQRAGSRFNKLFGRKKATSKELVGSSTAAESTSSLDRANNTEIYWPTDLLPLECPQARIMVWGYDTMVTRGPAQAANKSGIFTHGRDLLFALDRQRDCRRPIIFVAHSLGGILVKELLSYADASKEDGFLNIVQDISAVVFLGTPHRGSDAARVGDIARRVASALRIDTSPAVLDSLGLRNDDLDRNQQSFARIWDERRFAVKTFQESKGLTGVNVGMLNDLIVPIESSTLGHPREHPESLDADHLSMCKFKGSEDPNYRKFGAELKKLYKLATGSGRGGETQPPLHDQHETPVAPVPVIFDPASDKALLSLAFQNMGLRERAVERPASGTCDWPLFNPDYQTWLTRSNVGEHRGLLRLIGHPGSGKSVLVKALAAAFATHAKCPETHVATFFFDARGTFDQKSVSGLLKALLFQLLPICAKTYNYFNNLHNLRSDRDNGDSAVHWQIGDLRDVLLRLCSVQRDTPICIFIDAVDECSDIEGKGADARSFADFLHDLADTSYNTNSNVNICLSSRSYPTVTIRYCAEIFVDVQNRRDIDLYVSRELQQYGFVSSEMLKIKDSLTSKARGVFLWARLVLSFIAQAFDAGLNLNLSSVLRYLAKLPGTLHELFDRILKKFSSKERVRALRLFQWAILAQRPLSADEWVHIIAFVDEPELNSIKESREGIYGVCSMEQLEKRLRNMTGGLLELTLLQDSRENDRSSLLSSMRTSSLTSIDSAVAGSMEPSSLDGRIVQFIHLSACQYFLTGDGFKLLGQTAQPGCFGAGHVYIAATCLRYTMLDEIKPLVIRNPRLVTATLLHSGPSGPPVSRHNRRLTKHHNSSGTNLSVVSFGSSAASSVRRRSLPASAPPSITTGKAHVVDTSGETHTQLTRELLEAHAQELRPITLSHTPARISPEDDAHSQAEHLENDFSEALSGPARIDSVSAHSTHVVLPNDPVLRLYVVEMYVHHVVAADQANADPSELLDVLHSGLTSGVTAECWHKLCQLSYHLKTNTTPAYFAAERDLITWIEWYRSSWQERDMLSKRGGRMRYPLLVAIFLGNQSAVACMSGRIDAEDHATDAWMMLHRLAAHSINANTNLALRQFSRGLTGILLRLSTSILTEDSDITFRSRLRSYTTKSCIDSGEFEDILAGIQALYSTSEYMYPVDKSREVEAVEYLDDIFQIMGC